MADMVLDQIYENLPDEIEAVCASLPSDFPEELRDSIADGAFRRSKIIAAAA
jgi:hypothetical protein